MKQFTNNKKKRKSNHLNKVTTILIFSEGTCTEPNYFESFKERINKNAIFKDSVIIEPYGLGIDTVRVVNKAKKYVNSHEIINANVWCVYDKDNYLDSDFNDADKLCKKYSKDGIIFESAWSNQSIEFWFVLHFSYYTSDNDRLKYEDFLNKKYAENNLGKYEKASKDTCNILEKYGNPKNAIKYAEKILKSHNTSIPSKCKPATKVHLLVKQLAMYLPEDDQKLYL